MKLLVLDGNSIVNRAFYGVKLLSTKTGMFTNAIYGFLTMFKKLCDETAPDAVAIAFDLREPTFRHKAYAEYKAKRKGMPEELAQQMPILQELLVFMGYKVVTCTGFEADDILGTLAATCEKSGDTCVIATGDRDSLQLVSEKTTVRLATTKFGQPHVTLYDLAKIKEEYGVEPKQLIDIKAIQGDASDNIPGVAGIGAKGAGTLIQTFGSVDYIYEHIDEIDIKPGMRDKLIKSKESAILSYSLGTIRVDAPVETEVKSFVRVEDDFEKTSALLVQLELFSLIERLGYDGNVAAESKGDLVSIPKPKVHYLTDGASVLPRIEDMGEAYFYSGFLKDGSISRMVFDIKGELFIFSPSETFFRAFAKQKGVKKYTSDTKRLHRVALKIGVNGVNDLVLDTNLAAYLLNPSATGYDLLRLASEYKVPVIDFEDMDFAEELKLGALIRGLSIALLKAVEENQQTTLLNTIEMPLAFVLAQMEDVGFDVDREGIAAYGVELQEKIELLQATIIEQVGYSFNINSPKQLGEALFDKLGLPHGKKTKTGWSTNADVLEGLRNLHPVVDEVLSYRTVAKLKSTYCDGLLKVISEDGRIHTNFNQTETRTGRISSTEPNMQNIPVRTPLGRELRKFFIAGEGKSLVDADYSQIELRVLAHVADDKAMQEDFNLDRDIHTATASRVFNIPEEMVTAEMRRRAKAVNFGIVYGIGAFSLSHDIGVAVWEAEEYIKEYLKNYSGVKAYMEQVVEKAKEKGYVETIYGRRRYLSELKSSNYNMRMFGERVALNMPIQGAAADIIKIAMIRVSNRLKKESLQAKLTLQVHDELIVECSNDEVEKVKALLTEEMEQAASLLVPMKADATVGTSWYEAKA